MRRREKVAKSATSRTDPRRSKSAEEGNRTPKGVSPGDFESAGVPDMNVEHEPRRCFSNGPRPVLYAVSWRVRSRTRTKHGQPLSSSLHAGRQSIEYPGTTCQFLSA